MVSYAFHFHNMCPGGPITCGHAYTCLKCAMMTQNDVPFCLIDEVGRQMKESGNEVGLHFLFEFTLIGIWVIKLVKFLFSVRGECIVTYGYELIIWCSFGVVFM